MGLFLASGAAGLLAACVPRGAAPIAPQPGDSPSLDEDSAGEMGQLAPAPGQASLPSGVASVRIDGVGTFEFDSSAVETVLPELFQPGHYSLFDVLVHLHREGRIDLQYHFDEAQATHVIDAIDGVDRWWYDAYYAGGWSELSSFRMDQYPYKRGTTLRIKREGADRMQELAQTFRDEVARLEAHGGQTIVPEVRIDSPRDNLRFTDVLVTPHDTRTDMLQPATLTGLDIILSLQDQGQLSDVRLTWYNRIGRADPVETYFVERINDAVASGKCGFVYEAGPTRYAGFRGNHVHIPSDVRVIVAPEYSRWFWICL
jgi:hypothetical protein